MSAPAQPWWKKTGDNMVRLGLIVLALLLVVNLIRSVESNYPVSKQIRSLHNQIAQVQDDETVITQENDYYKTDTYKEIMARERLGYIKPGEKMVLVPENKDTSASSNSTSSSSTTALSEAQKSWNEQPPYEQWYLLFFGSQTLLEETFGS